MASLEEYFAGGAAEDAQDGLTDSDSLIATDGQLEDILSRSGLDSADAQAQTLKEAQAKYTAPIPGGGMLLEASDAKVYQAIEREIKAQKRLAKNRDESRKHWEFVVAGAQFSILEKSEDQSIFKQLFPPDVSGTPEPIPNKIADVKGKMLAQILVDTPLPKPVPDGDDDRVRVAQDLTRKFLRANGAPDAMNDSDLFHSALDLSMTGKSGFAFVWVDPMGGGWRPMQVKAHPQATDPDHPLFGPKLDPQTGEPVTMPDGTVITERAVDPVLRYVAETTDENGIKARVFTDSPAAAARQWLPKMKRKLLPAAQVRTIPRTADVMTAHGIILLMCETMAEAKDRFPVLHAMSPDQIKQLTKWRPKDWRALVPEAMRDKPSSENGEAEVGDDTLLFWYHRFCRVAPDYKDGGEVAVNGAALDGAPAGFVLCRDTLREDVETDDGKTVPIVFDPPIAQWRGLNDVRGGDPFGIEVVSLFGGANDIYAHMYMSILETIDKGLHRNVFISVDSPISRVDYNRRDGTPLYIDQPGDKPEYEPELTMPAFTMDVLDRIDRAINSLAMTNETTNGLDSTFAKSGVAKQVSINQAKVGLRQLWQNMVIGCVTYWTICTRLAQAKLSVPQQVRLTGQDSAYKARWWVGSDLVGVSRIALEPGSGTMMPPAEKAQWLAQLQGQTWIDPEQAGELARASMTDDLGLPPNVHEEHINRCIADWIEGPPAGWEDQYEQNQQIKAQAEAAQQAASSSPGMPQAPLPQMTPLSTPFEPRPNDEDPFVAKIQAGKLSRLMASADYFRFKPSWRSTVDAKYAKAFYAAGGQTVAQQAQAAQQAKQGEETFVKFKADIEAKVMSLVTTELAKVLAGGEMAGGQQQPEEGADQNADAAKLMAAKQASDATMQNAAAQREHDARQAALTRAHTSAENAHDRMTELRKHAIAIAAKAGDAALGSAVKAQQPAQPQQRPQL